MGTRTVVRIPEKNMKSRSPLVNTVSLFFIKASVHICDIHTLALTGLIINKNLSKKIIKIITRRKKMRASEEHICDYLGDEIILYSAAIEEVFIPCVSTIFLEAVLTEIVFWFNKRYSLGFMLTNLQKVDRKC